MLFLNSCEFHTFLIKKGRTLYNQCKEMNTQTHTQTHTPMIIAHNFFRRTAPWWAIFFLTFKAQRAARGCRPRTPAFLSQGLPPLDPATSADNAPSDAGPQYALIQASGHYDTSGAPDSHLQVRGQARMPSLQVFEALVVSEFGVFPPRQAPVAPVLGTRSYAPAVAF